MPISRIACAVGGRRLHYVGANLRLGPVRWGERNKTPCRNAVWRGNAVAQYDGISYRFQPPFVLIRPVIATPRLSPAIEGQSTALLCWIGGVFCSLLLAGMAYQVHENYQGAQSQAQAQASDTAFQVAEWVAGSFPATEMLLNDLIGQVSPDELAFPPPDYEQYVRRGTMLRDKLATLPKGNVIGFFDRNCVNTHSANAQRIDLSNGRNFSQRDYCALARQASPEMKVDNLMVSSLNNDLQVMAVKRFPHPRHEFVGFAAVSLRLGFFGKWLERLQLAPRSEVLIVDSHRRLIALTPAAPERLGKVVESALLQDLIAGQQTQASGQWASSLDGVERFYRAEKVPQLPFVVLSGVSVQTAMAGFWQAAQVYVLGSAVLILLVVWVIGLSVQRQRHAVALAHLASTDVLSGLTNRRKLQEELDTEFLRAQRLQRSFAVLMLDIDKFKAINDTHGHASGDVVIQRVADLSAGLIRQVDSIGRWGGEEFVVLLREPAPGEVRLIAERIRAAIAEAPIVLAPDVSLHVTCSVGIAVQRASDGSAQAVLERADRALYQAKNAGRNRAVELNDDAPAPAGARLAPQVSGGG